MHDRQRLKGLDAWAHRLSGRYQRRSGLQSHLKQDALSVQQYIQQYADASEDALQAMAANCREALCRDAKEAQGKLHLALAVVCLTAQRHLGLMPYLVQVMGALAIHRGVLAELATGEGKTLTVGLSAVLTGWSGKPCHVLTANDYLATRDADEMRALYEACGLQVSSCLESHRPEERQTRYTDDIVYVTPKILLADVLRDVLAKRSPSFTEQQLCLPRGLHTAIVDEADSMLIDESVTPLIVSAPREIPGLHDAVIWAYQFTEQLTVDVDYSVDPDRQLIALSEVTEALITKQRSRLPVQWRSQERMTDLVMQALKVREFFNNGIQYLVNDDAVVLIDEFTGRLTPERSLSSGLHQAIEAKEGVPLTDPNFPLVQMTFQHFFRSFRKLACTTGTAHEAATELWSIYETPVIKIPTNKPRNVDVRPVQAFKTNAEKIAAIVSLARQLKAQGIPALIGVRSVSDSHSLSEQMQEAHIEHHVLNAIQHEREAEIIQFAGHPGQITIATNMAGRGVDIKVPPSVLENGGLHVMIAEPNDSARVDRQLMGRCGRQGNPGCVHRFASVEDTIFKRQLTAFEQVLLARVPSLPPPFASDVMQRAIKLCQHRFETRSYQSRKGLLDNEEWLDSALPFNRAE